MTPEQALTWIAILGGGGTALNVWLTLSIRNSILQLKLWAVQEFVAKDDIPQYLQMAESKARVLRAGTAS